MADYTQDIKVKYGGFEFPVPSPFVSRSYKNQYVGGELWGTSVEITLTGQVAVLPKRDGGSSNDYLNLKNQRDAVAKAFAGALGKNFQTLTVSGHDTNFILNNCSVTGLSFGSSPYRGLLDYTISITGYDNTNDFVTSNYGVSSPTDSWAYSDAGGTASLVHTISAQGYNSSTNGSYDAFLKAKAFVESRKGVSNKIPSFLIENAHPGSALILTSRSEQVNRLGGSYSLTENYSFATNESQEAAGLESNVPKMQTANILFSYSLSIDEQQGGDFVSMTLSGNVAGDKSDSTKWNQVKEDFRSRDFYELANEAYKNYVRGGENRTHGQNIELNKSPINFSVNPNEEARTIGFSLTYDNNDLYEKAKIKNAQGAYFDYNISFQHDNILDVITVSCSGTIRVRGSLVKRNEVAKSLLDLEVLKDNSFRVRKEAQELYHKMYPARSGYKLSPRPSNINVNQNEFDGTITYSASFSDDDFPEESELEAFGYSVQVTPSTQEYKPVGSCEKNGHYLVFDLNLATKREKANISVNANADSRNAKATEGAWNETKEVSDLLLNSLLKEVDGNGNPVGDVLRLENENKVENKDSGAITYSRAFSREKAVEDLTLLKI